MQVVRWDEFARMFARAHKPGEHVALVGPTGSGKSVVALELTAIIGQRRDRRNPRRPHRAGVIATKPQDKTLRAFMDRRGYKIVKKWPPAFGEEHWVVWPRPKGATNRGARQAPVVRPLLDAIYDEGHQTVCIDEAATFERPLPKGLGLAATMEEFWGAARSSELTCIAGTQRPRHVTRSMWSEPSWVVMFAPEDEDDLKRVAQLSGMKDRVLEVGDRLRGHEFLCIRRQRGGQRGLYVSMVGT